jgi:hypothetical protein
MVFGQSRGPIRKWRGLRAMKCYSVFPQPLGKLWSILWQNSTCSFCIHGNNRNFFISFWNHVCSSEDGAGLMWFLLSLHICCNHWQPPIILSYYTGRAFHSCPSNICATLATHVNVWLQLESSVYQPSCHNKQINK